MSMLRRLHSSPGRSRKRGLSLVELMVGITIGLFILAAATLVATNQLGDNRKLLLEAQVQQDMRVITDLVSRELRRAGYWGKANFMVWPAAAASAVNPYSAMNPADAASASKITFTRSRDEEGNIAVVSEKNDPLTDLNQAGFEYDPKGLTIKTLMGNGKWETLNDPQVLAITRFEIAMQTIRTAAPCGASCPATGDGGCPLFQSQRNAVVQIVGQSAVDNTVRRSVLYNVRLRNDLVGC